MKHLVCCFLVVSLLLSPPAFLCAENGVLLTEELQLKVADAFMEEGEYYRAVTEYKRFSILFPNSAQSDYALYKTGLACFNGEAYEDAAHTFARLREKYHFSRFAVDALFHEGLSYWRLKRYREAKGAFAVIPASYPQSPYAPMGMIANSLIALDEEDPRGSAKELESFLSAYPDHPGVQGAGEAIVLLEKYRNLPHKSEVAAAVMSAIIPGSGHVYAGHVKDGITAFIINALAIAGISVGVQQENYAVSLFMGGLGFPFYLGNIYGAANAAGKWNVGIRKEIRDKIFILLGYDF